MAIFDDEVTLSLTQGASRAVVEVRDWGVATSQGHVRPQNEDAWGNTGLTRFALADGMGGTSGGMLAAESSVTAFLSIDASVGWVPELVELNRIVSGICHASGFENAGSTLVGLEIEEHRCVTVHIGDSRMYRLRQRTLQLLTTDHNLRNLRLEEGVDPDTSDDRGAPRALTSWIGAAEEPDRIDVGTLSVQEHDRVLLVSDGVSGQLGSDEIEAVLIEEASAATAAEVLVASADSAGGRDNATALVVDLGVQR